MSNCKEYQELISRMLDGELSEAETARLHAHISECGDCRRMLDAFNMLHDTMAEDLEEPPEALAASVMEQIRREPVSIETAKKKRPHIGRWAALAACLAIVVFSAARLGLFSGANGKAAEAPLAAQGEAFLMESKTQDFARDELTGGSLYAEKPQPAEAPASDCFDCSNAQMEPAEEAEEAFGPQAPDTLEYEGETWRFCEYANALPELDPGIPRAEVSAEPAAAPTNGASLPDAVFLAEPNDDTGKAEETDENFAEDRTVRLVDDRLYVLLDSGLWAVYEK